MSLADSVRAGLAKLEPLDVRDRATADLALLYAEGIDDATAVRDDGERPAGWQDKQRDPLAELGPKLLAALTALGMTPAARKAVTAPPTGPAKSPLDELRERRATRGST